MSPTALLRRSLVLGAAITVCAALLAPSAHAATTTSCTDGFSTIGSSGFSASCVDFVDTGSPYIFQLATLKVWNYLYPPPQFYLYTNVVATCSSYSTAANGSIIGNDCLFQT